MRNRLLTAVLVLTFAGLVVVDTAVYFSMHSFLFGRIDQQLVGASSNIQSAVQDPGMQRLIDLDQLNAVVPGVFVQIRDSSDQVLTTSFGRGRYDSEVALSLPKTITKSKSHFSVESDGDSSYRAYASVLPDGNQLIVALPTKEPDNTLHRIILVESIVSLAVLLGAAGAGLWLVRVGLRPLNDMRATARLIGEGDLSQRVGVDDEKTEVGQLGQSLNLMLGQIETAFDERRQSEERMSRFVADASHELRTPLSAVRAYAELFDRGASGNPEDLGRSMRGISSQAARMGLLVDELLLLTRLDQGRPLENEPVDLTALVGEAIGDARVIAPTRQILFEADPAVVVDGDSDRLRQVLDNLLTNANRHTPVDATVDVSVRRTAAEAVVTVSDNGPGLSEEQRAHVFDRFYRADAARTRASGGSGLGLAIVEAIVRAHGGSVSVEPASSAPEQGARFQINLPIAGVSDTGS